MVAVFSEYFYMLSFNLFVISYIAYYKIGRFIFLSVSVFMPSALRAKGKGKKY